MPKQRWLEQLIDEYITSVSSLQNDEKGYTAAEHCAQWIKGKWAQRGLTSIDQQKDLIADAREMIKRRLGSDHIALRAMIFPRNQGLDVNHLSVNQEIEPIVLSPKAVNAIVYRATNLLVRNNWADIACGIAILTGRLHAEVMKTGIFDWKSDFSIAFSNGVKQPDDSTNSSIIELPTLSRADYVLSAITKLRAMVLTHTLTSRQVKARYSEGVFLACGRHFEDLVPSLMGKHRYHTYLFHRLYATIAHYFYCPDWVSDQEFKTYVKGQTSLESDSLWKSSHRINDSYEMDVVEDEYGGQKKGIRLAQHGVKVIDVFQRIELSESSRNGFHNLDADDKRHIAEPDSGTQVSFTNKSTEVQQETTMAKDNLSSFELITYSEAYQRAVERGFTGSKREFRGASTKQASLVASKYGVQRDRSILNPAINQPTWRDLHVQIESPKASKTKKPVAAASKTAKSAAAASKTAKPVAAASKTAKSAAAASKTAKSAAAASKTAKSAAAASKTAKPALPVVLDSDAETLPEMPVIQSETELEFVRKLSTGIDFLSREVDTLRAERDILRSERDAAQAEQSEALASRDAALEKSDRLQKKNKVDLEEFKENILEREQQIKSLEEQVISLQEQLSDLNQTYQELEPILNLMGRAQAKLRDVSPEAAMEQSDHDLSLAPRDMDDQHELKPEKKVASSQKTKKTKNGDRPENNRNGSTKSKSKGKAQKVDHRSNNAATSVQKPSKSQSDAQEPTAILDEAVVNALDAIMAYNDEPGRIFEEKWAISYPVMKELLTQVGASTQTKIKAVFDDRGKEIDHHMKKHGLGKRHNRNHQGESISDVLKLAVKK